MPRGPRTPEGIAKVTAIIMRVNAEGRNIRGCSARPHLPALPCPDSTLRAASTSEGAGRVIELNDTGKIASVLSAGDKESTKMPLSAVESRTCTFGEAEVVPYRFGSLGEELLGTAGDLYTATRTILAGAVAAGDSKTALEAIRECLRNLELQARLRGLLNDESCATEFSAAPEGGR